VVACQVEWIPLYEAGIAKKPGSKVVIGKWYNAQTTDYLRRWPDTNTVGAPWPADFPAEVIAHKTRDVSLCFTSSNVTLTCEF
jgi:hypothetical protein